MLVLSLLVACNDKTQTVPASPQSNNEAVASTVVPNAQHFVVATDAAYPPYNFKDEAGNAQGFDIDLIRAIADNQGFAVDIIIQEWSSVLPGLEDNQNDIAISGMVRTEERESKYLLSNTYAWGMDAIAVKAGDDSINAFSDLVGKKTAALADTGYIEQLEAIMGKNNPNIVATPTDFMAFKELSSGNVAAMVSERGVIKHYAKSFPEVNIRIIENVSKPDDLVIAISKSKPELLDKVNAGLSAIVADGTYVKIYEKWFGATPEQLPTTK